MSLDNVHRRRRGGQGQHRCCWSSAWRISIPLIVFGSQLLIKLMERFPIIITVGAALLGWMAGEMAAHRSGAARRASVH